MIGWAVQDMVATVAAIAAAAVLVRHVLGFVTPKPGGPCAGCPSHRPSAAAGARSAPVAIQGPLPIKLLHSPKRS